MIIWVIISCITTHSIQNSKVQLSKESWLTWSSVWPVWTVSGPDSLEVEETGSEGLLWNKGRSNSCWINLVWLVIITLLLRAFCWGMNQFTYGSVVFSTSSGLFSTCSTSSSSESLRQTTAAVGPRDENRDHKLSSAPSSAQRQKLSTLRRKALTLFELVEIP